MIKKRILVIADNLDVCRSIREAMQDEHTDVCYTMSIEEALDAFAAYDYRLIIVGPCPSDEASMEVLHIIRKGKTTPVLILANTLTEDKTVAWFHEGANAVLAESVDIPICVAQGNALIQLYTEQTDAWTYHPMIFGTELIIDPTYRQVIIDGKQLALTRKEFDLLVCLARHPGQVWSRTQLYSQVWSDDLGIGGENVVKSHIGNLRKKLADIGKDYIQTLWGVGYKFVPPSGKEKDGAT